MQPIAFIDLEASGLGAASWPVEVGWCFLDGAPTSMLVRPDENWPDDAWDPAAAALHGLTRGELKKRGAPAQTICNAMNEALAGAVVYSDAPDWDGFWLYRLFSAAKARQAFQVFDFADLFEAAPPVQYEKARAAARKSAPHRHRAKDDVLHMRALYQHVYGGA